jgi:hypothetical protein
LVGEDWFFVRCHDAVTYCKNQLHQGVRTTSMFSQSLFTTIVFSSLSIDTHCCTCCCHPIHHHGYATTHRCHPPSSSIVAKSPSSTSLTAISISTYYFHSLRPLTIKIAYGGDNHNNVSNNSLPLLVDRLATCPLSLSLSPPPPPSLLSPPSLHAPRSQNLKRVMFSPNQMLLGPSWCKFWACTVDVQLVKHQQALKRSLTPISTLHRARCRHFVFTRYQALNNAISVDQEGFAPTTWPCGLGVGWGLLVT